MNKISNCRTIVYGLIQKKSTVTLSSLRNTKATPNPDLPGYDIRAEVRVKAETGVEMEALTAVSIAALTLYDMAKALEKSMQITNIRLLSKTGGKSGDYLAAP